MEAAAKSESFPGTEVLQQTPAIIEKILHGATPDQLHWKPAPDRWSIGEVLAHLVEVETVNLSRARAMVEQHSPAVEAYDQNAAYAAGNYSGRDAREQLIRFGIQRDTTLSFLRSLPASAALRAARHAEIGLFTLAELLNEWAFHDLGHIRQIAELYRARAFFPRMGTFQRYYTVRP